MSQHGQAGCRELLLQLPLQGHSPALLLHSEPVCDHSFSLQSVLPELLHCDWATTELLLMLMHHAAVHHLMRLLLCLERLLTLVHVPVVKRVAQACLLMLLLVLHYCSISAGYQGKHLVKGRRQGVSGRIHTFMLCVLVLYQSG